MAIQTGYRRVVNILGRFDYPTARVWLTWASSHRSGAIQPSLRSVIRLFRGPFKLIRLLLLEKVNADLENRS